MNQWKLFFVFLVIIGLQLNARPPFDLIGWAFPPNPIGTLLEKCRHQSNRMTTLTQMKTFLSLSVEEYGKKRGKNLNFFEKVSYKTSQRRMKQMLKYYEYGEGPTTMQKIGALIKGLILGPIALLLGYLFLKKTTSGN